MKYRAAFSRTVRRGITHVELAAAVALLALVAFGIGMVVKPGLDAEKANQAEHAARDIKNAIEDWQSTNQQGCPTLSQLVHEKHLSRDARMDDPWGSRYRVECTDDDVVVSSAGRDRKAGTADDVRVRAHRS